MRKDEFPVSDWQPSACNLCECNCGIEIQLGGRDGREFVKIRGDKQHPGSHGYACEKPLRLNHYQNGPDRITKPLRRTPQGTFEEIDWDTAIREVAQRLSAVRDEHGGESILYYGGGGQGNHSPGAYSQSTRAALGMRYSSNALAQEKTGEFWVSGRMVGGFTRGDFDNAEVVVFLGKNPWMSHGIPHARVTLKNLAKDPNRCLIVIDPKRSETADLADIHLQVKPGRDAWLIAAMAAVLVQEDLMDGEWLAAHADGVDEIAALLREIDIPAYAAIAGVDEALVRDAARRIGKASSVSVGEDLGIQMNLQSTLVSYLERMLWMLTGNFAKKGGHYMPSALQPLIGKPNVDGQGERKSPVTGERIITGLIPCNAIPDEILTDHPKRFRAMLVESGNPAHSLADSPRMREALESLDTLVVIDIAMTETARLADYILPVPTQFEKAEFTLFNFEFPENVFQLRHPLLVRPEGLLTEAEIHARLTEELGAMPTDALPALRKAAKDGLTAYAEAFVAFAGENPGAFRMFPVVLYRTLGEALPENLAEAAVLWGASLICTQTIPDSVRRAGIEGEGLELANALFEKILASPRGLVFTVDDYDESFKRVGTAGGRIQLWNPELEDAVRALDNPPSDENAEFPFVLSAGERRSFTANTIFRDARWRKKDAEGALNMSPADGERLGVADGGRVRITTRRGEAEAVVRLTDRMQPGHISLPNGLGLSTGFSDGKVDQVGVAPNELTSTEDRDPIAGTPWHKRVPARVEVV